jgi:hypothetical protein
MEDPMEHVRSARSDPAGISDRPQRSKIEVVDQRRENYLGFVDQQTALFHKLATRSFWFYNVERIALILFSVSLPAVAVSTAGSPVSWLAVSVAILAALDGVFKPGDSFRQYRGVELALMRERRRYEADLVQVDLEIGEERRIALSRRLLAELIENVEGLLREAEGGHAPRRPASKDETQPRR